MKNIKDPKSRLARWRFELDGYDYTIRHKPGTLHINADSLSRQLFVASSAVIIDWKQEQIKDKEIQIARKSINNKNLMIRNKVLVRKWIDPINNHTYYQMVLPSKFRQDAIKRAHDEFGHYGFERTISLLQPRFWWPRMREDVKRWIQTCNTCQKNKGTTIKKQLQRIQTTANWEMIALDIKGKLTKSLEGHDYILVIMDLFSKFVMAYPMKKITSTDIIKVLRKHIIPVFGIPEKILTDRGSNFLSQEVSKYLKQNGIQKVNTTPYHPQSNGSVERFNRTIETKLRMLNNNQQKQWNEYIPEMVRQYNATTHSSHGATPFYIMFGRDPLLSVDKQ